MTFETPSELPTTPTALSPAPRRVRRKRRHAMKVWIARIFILPHILIGLGAIAKLILLILWTTSGITIPGIVTKAEITNSHDQKYRLYYTYTVGSVNGHDSQSISEDIYNKYHADLIRRPAKPVPIDVHYYAIGSWTQVGLPQYGPPEPSFTVILAWSVGWNLVMCLFVYQCWIVPARAASLIIHGQAVAGTITSKRDAPGRNNCFYVSYNFINPLTNQQVAAEFLTTGIEWDSVEPAQEITVLFDPKRPQKSAPYELCEYKIA